MKSIKKTSNQNYTIGINTAQARSKRQKIGLSVEDILMDNLFGMKYKSKKR